MKIAPYSVEQSFVADSRHSWHHRLRKEEGIHFVEWSCEASTQYLLMAEINTNIGKHMFHSIDQV